MGLRKISLNISEVLLFNDFCILSIGLCDFLTHCKCFYIVLIEPIIHHQLKNTLKLKSKEQKKQTKIKEIK